MIEKVHFERFYLVQGLHREAGNVLIAVSASQDEAIKFIEELALTDLREEFIGFIVRSGGGVVEDATQVAATHTAPSVRN